MHFKRMDMHVHSCHSSEAIPGVSGVLFSPWIVRRHFRGQLEMARIALSNLSAFGELPRTLLDAA